MSGPVDDYLKYAETEMLPKMKASAFCLSIQADKVDIKQCLEIGAAVLYDKPIIVWVPEGRKIPANLQRVATVVVDGDIHAEATKKRIGDAIQNLLKNDARVRR